MTTWNISTDYDPGLDADLVTIWRRRADYVEVIESIDGTAGATVRRVELGAAVNGDPPPLQFPRGLLAAIAAHLHPGPTEDTVAEIRSALDTERYRVDFVLRTLLDRAPIVVER